MGVPKLCGARDGGAQAPQGWAEGACFGTPIPPATSTVSEVKTSLAIFGQLETGNHGPVNLIRAVS